MRQSEVFICSHTMCLWNWKMLPESQWNCSNWVLHPSQCTHGFPLKEFPGRFHQEPPRPLYPVYFQMMENCSEKVHKLMSDNDNDIIYMSYSLFFSQGSFPCRHLFPFPSLHIFSFSLHLTLYPSSLEQLTCLPLCCCVLAPVTGTDTWDEQLCKHL